MLTHDRIVPDTSDLLGMTKDGINKVLCYFIHEVRDKNGKCYNRDTLYDLITMINAFFKENGKIYCFFDDPEFFVLKNTLDNRMKDLSAEGLIAPRIQAEPITTEELNILWDKKLLGDANPQQLLETLILLNGTLFAMRAAKEHYDMKVDQIQVYFDSSLNQKYLFYHENISKCNQGGIKSRGVRPKKGRAYQNLVNPDRCLVRLHELYISLRPTDPKCSNKYYLRPLTDPQPGAKVWYSCQARGKHKIEGVVAKICENAGFSGRRSNHSARAAAATNLYENGIDEQLIQEKTGHRSVAVRSYKRTSSRQMKQVSDILYGNVVAKDCDHDKKVESCTVSKPPVEESDCNNTSPKKIKSTSTVAQTHDVDSKAITININLNISK